MVNDFVVYAEPDMKLERVKVQVSKKGLSIVYYSPRMILNRVTSYQKNIIRTLKRLVCDGPTSWDRIQMYDYMIEKHHRSSTEYYPVKINIANTTDTRIAAHITLQNQEAEEILEQLLSSMSK